MLLKRNRKYYFGHTNYLFFFTKITNQYQVSLSFIFIYTIFIYMNNLYLIIF